MILFPRDIPRYVIADRCPVCKDLWIPKTDVIKGVVKRCFCCGERLKSKRKTNSKHKTKKTNEEIALLLEKKMGGGWQPIKKEVIESIIKYKKMIALLSDNNDSGIIPEKEMD